MTDILKELREPIPMVEGYSGEYVDIDVVSDIFREAADEIERLREALKQVGLYAWQGDTFKIMDIVRETIIGKEK